VSILSNNTTRPSILRFSSNKMKSFVGVVVFSLATSVAGHGFVQQIMLGDNLIDTWNPYKDPQKDPPVNKTTRKFKDNGPVTDGLFTVSLLPRHV
jgi:hypothetical protein